MMSSSHRNLLAIPRQGWLLLLAAGGIGCPGLFGEEMREIAPGGSKGGSRVESADRIRPPLLDRIEGFDLRRGRVPSAAPDPGPAPARGAELSPAQKKKALDLLDRRKNWLLENAAAIHRMESGELPEDGDQSLEEMNPGMTRSLNRLLQATERVGGDDSDRDTDRRPGGRDRFGSGPDLSTTPGGGDDSDQGRSGHSDVGVRIIPEDGLSRGESRSSAVFGGDPERQDSRASGMFSKSPERSGGELFPDQRRTTREDPDSAASALSTRRAGAFEQMLNTPTEDATGEGASGFFGRSAEARSSAFQALLQAPDWSSGSAGSRSGPGLFAPPNPGAAVGAAPARAIGLPAPASPGLSSFTAPGSAALPAPAPRFEPRPISLPIPTRRAF